MCWSDRLFGLRRAADPPVLLLTSANAEPAEPKSSGQRFRWSEGQFVGLGGLEPPASSLSAKCREPLCGRPFLQVALDRRGRS
jgi:hypothetical protein